MLRKYFGTRNKIIDTAFKCGYPKFNKLTMARDWRPMLFGPFLQGLLKCGSFCLLLAWERGHDGGKSFYNKNKGESL
ncbi:hypothetical protein AS29_005945 [Bacillus sp. SJS]|nr:hypothetical protein AS29_005945 [Bacillus sp. SJS]